MELTFPENKIPEKARLNRFVRVPIITFALVKTVFGDNPFDVNSAIEQYNFDIDKSNNLQFLRLKLKMVYYRYAYEFRYNEFASYGFEHKSKKKCLEYVAAYEYLRIRNEITAKEDYIDYFSDKRKTYKYFKDFFKRDVAIIEKPEDIQYYIPFVQKHKKFVLKKAKMNNGSGVTIIDTQKDNAVAIFKKALSEGGAIAEELICQPGILHQLHPSSVNTVRFVTFYDNNKLTNIAAVLRFGAGGATIDNATQGGLFACINIKTGVIESDGKIEFKSDIYKKHPDTNVTIKGIQLPGWDDLLNIVSSIVKICPNKKYVGWDFAYSDKGWVLVEGNGYPGLYLTQMGSGKGLRKTFSQTYFTESKYCDKYSKGIY